MAAYEHEGLRVDVDQGVAFVTLDHPPVNLFDAVLIGSLGDLAGELADDAEVGAVVVRSADPEFFSYRRSQAHKEPDYGRQISAIVLT